MNTLRLLLIGIPAVAFVAYIFPRTYKEALIWILVIMFIVGMMI